MHNPADSTPIVGCLLFVEQEQGCSSKNRSGGRLKQDLDVSYIEC